MAAVVGLGQPPFCFMMDHRSDTTGRYLGRGCPIPNNEDKHGDCGMRNAATSKALVAQRVGGISLTITLHT